MKFPNIFRRKNNNRNPAANMFARWLSNQNFGQADLLAGVPTIPTSFAYEFKTKARRLQAQTQYLVKENHTARAAMRLMVNNVIGEGLNLRAKIEAGKKEKIDAAWNKWAKICAGKSKNFQTIEREVCKSLVVWGEAFVLTWINKEGVLRLRTVSPAMLRPDLDRETYKGGEKLPANADLELGIETVDGDVTAYHFLGAQRYRNIYEESLSEIQGPTTRVAADMCLHVFVSEDPEQTRGWPWLAPVETFLALAKYSAVELVASILHTCQMLIMTPKDGESQHYAGNTGRPTQAQVSAQPDPEAPPERQSNVPGTEAKALGVKPGQVVIGTSAMDVTAWNPQHPTKNFETFMDRETAAVSSAMGLASYDVSGNLGNINYSSGRLGNLSQHETFKLLRSAIVSQFHVPVFVKWLENEREQGRLPGMANRDYESLLDSTFRGKAPRHVDPNKEASAVETRLKTGTLSWEKAVLEAGYDPDETLREIAETKEKFEAAGLEAYWKNMHGIGGNAPAANAAMQEAQEKIDENGGFPTEPENEEETT